MPTKFDVWMGEKHLTFFYSSGDTEPLTAQKVRSVRVWGYPLNWRDFLYRTKRLILHDFRQTQRLKARERNSGCLSEVEGGSVDRQLLR